jgi:hypothetical protein
MMRQWTRHNARTPARMRQCTGCVQASVRHVPPSVQKTGMRILWPFFVHSTPVTRIHIGPFGVYTPVHRDDPCTHCCEQGVYNRVYILFPINIYKGGCAWHPVA